MTAPGPGPRRTLRVRRAGAGLLAALGLALAGCSGGAGPAAPPPAAPFVEVPVSEGADIPAADAFGQPVRRPQDISSTFGPRWKFSAGRFDFHRGIDFFGARGDPLLAIGEGVVSAVYPAGSPQFPNGGNTLVVRHELATPFAWRGVTVERIFALYLHMDGFAAAAGDPVARGQVLGGMGDSGNTRFVHLHFEIRVQTPCSLEFQRDNPGAACARWGFDPHVHPFAFIGGRNEDALTVASRPGPPFVITYEATRGDLDLNVVETEAGRLNFNRRTGIDASSTASLDDFDYGWVKVVPDVFVSGSAVKRIAFHFPRRPAFVKLLDIHGNGLRRTYLP